MRLFILLLLLSAVWAPAVTANENWRADGWLSNLGNERIKAGDEFGCYGIPGRSWHVDSGAVSGECMDYLSERISASKWGSNPVSTYTPPGLSAYQHELIASNGFSIHGDNTGLANTAWHSSNDTPSDVWDWYNLGRRGGSLEKGIANVQILEEELDLGGLVNLYWIGRIHDSIVRHDTEVINVLESRSDLWFTTWGEAWSYWAVERCHSFNHSKGGDYLVFQVNSEVSCTSLTMNRWDVPVTWIIEIGNASVLDVNLPLLYADDKHITEGWRLDDQTLFLSVKEGTEVYVNFSNDFDYEIVGRAQFFNNHTSAVTIAGHSTTDLFSWSKRFDDHPDLRFTWLVSPQELDDGIPWLPQVAIFVAVATVSVIFWVVKSDTMEANVAEDFKPMIRREDDDE